MSSIKIKKKNKLNEIINNENTKEILKKKKKRKGWLEPPFFCRITFNIVPYEIFNFFSFYFRFSFFFFKG